MKKSILFLLIIIFGLSEILNAQSTCSTAIWDHNGLNFTPAAPLGTVAQTGPDYSDLDILSRPLWGYIVGCGNIQYYLNFGTDAIINPVPAIKYGIIIWGPYNNLNNVCGNLISSKIVYKKDSISVGSGAGAGYIVNDHPVINAVPGEIYFYMLTNNDTTASFDIKTNAAFSNGFQGECFMCNDEVSNLLQHDICMVTIDPVVQKTRIIWEKIPDAGVAGYVIWRGPHGAGPVDSLGLFSENDTCDFLDLTSHPLQYGEEYKLQPVDSCGNFNFNWLYPTHKVCFLQATPAGNNTANLNWNGFGIPFNEYEPVQYVYRGASPSNMQIIDTIPVSVISYTDITAPPGQNYYSIERRRLAACNPLRITSSSNYLGSFSNPSGVSVTGIPIIEDENLLSVNPIPATNFVTLTVDKSLIGNKISIVDITGKIVHVGLIKNTSENIDVSQFSSGNYWLSVTGKERIIKKIAISR